MTLIVAFVLFLQFPQSSVSGRIEDLQSRNPIPDVTILLEGTSLKVKSDTNGNFTIGPVPFGLYQLRLVHLDYISVRQEVLVSDSAKTLCVSMTSKYVYLISHPVEIQD